MVFTSLSLQFKKYVSSKLPIIIPTLFLIRHHQLRSIKVIKDRPQVDQVKTGIIFMGKSVLKLEAMDWTWR